MPRGHGPQENSVSVTLVHSISLLKQGLEPLSMHGSITEELKQNMKIVTLQLTRWSHNYNKVVVVHFYRDYHLRIIILFFY